jgi:hypothetical protein
MRKVFGKASDFFEVKLYQIREVIPEEFEWDELTAYLGARSPVEPQSRDKFEIQFIFKDTGSVLKRLEFENYDEAKLKCEEINDELMNSEVMEFIERHALSLEE